MESLNPSVLERQRAHLQWQQQGYNNVDQSFVSLQNDQCFGSDHGCWPNRITHCNIREEEMGTAAVSNSRTSSADRVATAKENKGTKKRKTHADKSPMVEGDDQQAKNRHGIERREASEESAKEKDEKKLDYIHVRARRGQATDSHSLAERVRRERISERMKYLQGLVPGCNKITGKAGMLDEIINYVQSLQKQVEFLSMKLATVSPRPDLNMESFFNKEINLGGELAISAFGMSASNLIDPSYVQSNFLQQLANCCGYDIAMNPTSELALRRNMSTPMSSPETFSDSCFNVPRPSSGLDNELHSLYGVEFHQGRSPTFSFHSLQGNLLPNNPKMEM